MMATISRRLALRAFNAERSKVKVAEETEVDGKPEYCEISKRGSYESSLFLLHNFSWESTVRLAGILAVVLYAVGMVIVNLYLTHIGVSDFTVIRVKFILTGIVSLLPLAVMIGAILISPIWTNSNHENSAALGIWGRFKAEPEERTPTVLTLLLGVSINVLIFVALQVPILLIVLSCFATLLYATFAVDQFTDNILRPSLSFKNPELPTSRRIITISLRLFLPLVFIYIYLSLFASLIYPSIPESLGGGEPRSVRLIASPDDRKLLSSIGIGFSDNPAVSDEMLIVWLGTDRLIVKIGTQDDSPLVELDKALVNGFYLSDVPSLPTPDHSNASTGTGVPIIIP